MTAILSSTRMSEPQRAEVAVPIISAESRTLVALAFAFKTCAAVLLALFLAFWLELDEPKWALLTVFVVSQPDSGLVLAKSFYRILGTIAGTLVSITLVFLFARTASFSWHRSLHGLACAILRPAPCGMSPHTASCSRAIWWRFSGGSQPQRCLEDPILRGLIPGIMSLSRLVTGKTHAALALGLAACQKGHSVIDRQDEPQIPAAHFAASH